MGKTGNKILTNLNYALANLSYVIVQADVWILTQAIKKLLAHLPMIAGKAVKNPDLNVA